MIYILKTLNDLFHVLLKKQHENKIFFHNFYNIVLINNTS